MIKKIYIKGNLFKYHGHCRQMSINIPDTYSSNEPDEVFKEQTTLLFRHTDTEGEHTKEKESNGGVFLAITLTNYFKLFWEYMEHDARELVVFDTREGNISYMDSDNVKRLFNTFFRTVSLENAEKEPLEKIVVRKQDEIAENLGYGEIGVLKHFAEKEKSKR